MGILSNANRESGAGAKATGNTAKPTWNAAGRKPLNTATQASKTAGVDDPNRAIGAAGKAFDINGSSRQVHRFDPTTQRTSDKVRADAASALRWRISLE